MLEKLRPAVHRRLLKRVARIHAAAEPTRPNQIPLGAVLDLRFESNKSFTRALVEKVALSYLPVRT